MTELALQPLPLAGLFSLQHRLHQDGRGAFARLYCEDTLGGSDAPFPVRQINRSRTLGMGCVRGLHYQGAPHLEAKLITCLRGEVWDVAVDLRPDSATFLHWHAEHLREGDGRSLLIPAGFAHGFQLLSDEAELLYLHSANYAPQSEGGLSVHDPRLGILWPLPVSNLSARDLSHPLLDDAFAGVRV
jgi:dTDP-4-dehydrorhamnose 3,5-epimerase